jgi:hypothetical protein
LSIGSIDLCDLDLSIQRLCNLLPHGNKLLTKGTVWRIEFHQPSLRGLDLDVEIHFAKLDQGSLSATYQQYQRTHHNPKLVEHHRHQTTTSSNPQWVLISRIERDGGNEEGRRKKERKPSLTRYVGCATNDKKNPSNITYQQPWEKKSTGINHDVMKIGRGNGRFIGLGKKKG